MASALYTPFKVALLSGAVDLTTDTIVAYAVNVTGTGTLYTYSAAHSALSDLTSGARVANATLASTTVTGGVFDSADPVLPSVTGDTFEAIVLYDSTAGVLIGYWDGLNQTPTGNNITINVNASGWFTLGG